MLPIVVTLIAILSFILAGLSAVPAALLGLVIGSLVGWHLERTGSTCRLPVTATREASSMQIRTYSQPTPRALL